MDRAQLTEPTLYDGLEAWTCAATSALERFWECVGHRLQGGHKILSEPNLPDCRVHKVLARS